MKEYLNQLINKQDLTALQMDEAMNKIMDGSVSPIQVAAFLSALETKQPTITEIASASKVMRSKAKQVEYDGTLIDIVGTGGDGLHLFNISTTSSFVVAGCGVKVAKHGNRGVSSKSGAADVLEALGITISMEVDTVKNYLDTCNMAFIFAQNYHTSMKNVGPIRKELGMKTIFNILGPLTNPSNIDTFVIGAYTKELVDILIEVYKQLGIKKAVVYHGDSSMDEVSLTGPTYMKVLNNGNIETMIIDPKDYGFEYCSIEDIKGDTPEVNASIVEGILKGEITGPKKDIVLLNSAVALYACRAVDSIEEGLIKANESISSGSAYKVLSMLRGGNA